ncbi:MAG: hypothetical protein M2R45_02998 [Verrucomicrobia subdivision 3 bacterium]|nr:hypothetical protein [Limisphaerales bacterium]MCS1416516.1 hypothetical protein [Limisphaerales bacterium]
MPRGFGVRRFLAALDLLRPCLFPNSLSSLKDKDDVWTQFRNGCLFPQNARANRMAAPWNSEFSFRFIQPSA